MVDVECASSIAELRPVLRLLRRPHVGGRGEGYVRDMACLAEADLLALQEASNVYKHESIGSFHHHPHAGSGFIWNPFLCSCASSV